MKKIVIILLVVLGAAALISVLGRFACDYAFLSKHAKCV